MQQASLDEWRKPRNFLMHEMFEGIENAIEFIEGWGHIESIPRSGAAYPIL